MRIKKFKLPMSCRIAVLMMTTAAIPPSLARVSVAATTANQEPASIAVSIDNFTFTPMDLTIPAGGQVTWTNKDDVPHTVVSVDHQFKSQALDTDEKFSFTFQNPGTYEYFCSVHPKMMGRITVK